MRLALLVSAGEVAAQRLAWGRFLLPHPHPPTPWDPQTSLPGAQPPRLRDRTCSCIPSEKRKAATFLLHRKHSITAVFACTVLDSIDPVSDNHKHRRSEPSIKHNSDSEAASWHERG